MSDKKLYKEFYNKHIKEANEICKEYFKFWCGMKAIAEILNEVRNNVRIC